MVEPIGRLAVFMRLPSDSTIRSKIQSFWGDRDLISGQEVKEFLAADGDEENHDWKNCLPIHLPGLTSEMLSSEVPLEILNANPNIGFDELQRRADFLAGFGETNRASGCLLAGQIIHSKMAFRRRDTSNEYALLINALYFLRRGIAKSPYLSIDSLPIYLFQLQKLLKVSVPDNCRKVFLLLELGSWLNELGHPELASPVLNEVRVLLKARKVSFSPQEYSRFARQMSQLCLALGRRSEAIHWLNAARGCGDASLHNAAGATIVLIQLNLLEDTLPSVLNSCFEFYDQFDRVTGVGRDNFARPLTGINIATSLAAILYRAALLDRLGEDSSYWYDVLKDKEKTGIGVATFTHNPFLIDLFSNRAGPSIFRSISRNRFLPRLWHSLAEELEATSLMLMEVEF